VKKTPASLFRWGAFPQRLASTKQSAKRLSTGGMVRGTCATLGRRAQAIGQDIAAWLNAPTMDAELGMNHPGLSGDSFG
jgi:hypothetical protein